MGALLSSTILCGRSLLATKNRRGRRGGDNAVGLGARRVGEVGESTKMQTKRHTTQDNYGILLSIKRRNQVCL